MELTTILSISAALLSVIGVIISYQRVKKQKRQELLLLEKLHKKEQKYMKELINALKNKQAISTLNLDISELEKQKRNEILEKYIRVIIDSNSEAKFSEVKDAIYYEKNHTNQKYLNKIYEQFIKQSKNRITMADHDHASYRRHDG